MNENPKITFCPYCGADAIDYDDNRIVPRCRICRAVFFVEFSRYMRRPASKTDVKHPLYHTWRNMLARCYNPKSPVYSCYGGRGITVCDRWLSFDLFASDVGIRPENHTLDRIRNNEGYSPDNFRWATMKMQSRNTRTNFMITANGMTKCLSEWAEILRISKHTLKDRIDLHGIDKAIAMGVNRTHQYNSIPLTVGGKIEEAK